MITALYVDDEPDLLNIIKIFLEKKGNIHTITADSSIKALEIIKNNSIDVIISDYDMPMMNGIELLIECRKSGYNIPFIIYTGKGRMEIVIQALEAGADSFIQKDADIKVQFAELLSKIQKVVRWKIAEDEIKKMDREWEGIFQSIGEAVLILSPQYFVISANYAACRLFGMSEIEIMGRTCYSLFHGGQVPENCPVTRSTISHHCETGEVFSEILLKTFIVGCTPVINDSGSVEKFIHISTDITDHKKIEEELLKYRTHLEELVRDRTYELAIAKEEAESANKAKSIFLSHMSHELRTPLNAILGYTQLLSRNDNLTDTQIEQLKTVYTSGKHLLSLINGLLDLSKIEAQVVHIDEKPFALPDVLKDIYNIIRVKAEEKNLHFFYNQKTVIPHFLLGDEAKIKQIFINILNNAVKYTKMGDISFNVGFDSGIDSILWCEIIDTGIGIPQDSLNDIFKPFTQVGSKEIPVEGTGLGLAITKSLVEYMNGTIKVQSKPGEGSTFRVELPLQITDSANFIEPIHRQITGYEGERKKILIVDDSTSNSDLLKSLLQPLGFLLSLVNNGYDALKMIKQINPDLILLDLVMSGIDGYDVLKEIRDNHEYDHIKIIGISAVVSLCEQKSKFKGLCDIFLEKPINIDNLLEKMGYLLNLHWNEKQEKISRLEDIKSDLITEITCLPGDDILKQIVLLARQGNFTKISTILTTLEEDTGSNLKEFILKIRNFSNRFDDDAIVIYINSLKDGHREC